MNKHKKYPRTLHLPWSESISDDDKVNKDVSCFKNKKVIVTEKTDGESCTMYNDKIHARSLDSKNHESRTWVNNLHSQIKHLIPENMRICGENLFAVHSIKYEKLTSFFLVHNIWIDDICLSWDETVKICKKLGLEHAKILYEGQYNEKEIKKLYTGVSHFGGEQEGYVIRIKESFSYENFSKNVAKFVRKNHVNSDDHWIYKKIEKNKMI